MGHHSFPQASFLQKVCFLEEMFPAIPNSTLYTALASSNGNLQEVLSFLVVSDEPRKDENCPSTSAASGCGIPCEGTGKTQSGAEEGVDSSLISSVTHKPPLISFSGPSVPQLPSLPSHPLSTLLSGDENRPQSSSSNDAPGRRPHRCHYCGLEWPAFMDNSHCPQCYMPYNKRDRY